MTVYQTLIFLVFITLQDGNTGVPIHTATEGGSITIRCKCSSPGQKKLFCKKKGELTILTETTNDMAQRGRYSIHDKDFLYLSITQLEKSDTGVYNCSLNESGNLESCCDFQIVVTDLPEFKKEALWVLVLPVVLFLVCKKKTENSDGLNRQRNPDPRQRNPDPDQTEVTLYENCSPVSTPDASIYQSLDPASRDLDQIYSSLTQIQQH